MAINNNVKFALLLAAVLCFVAVSHASLEEEAKKALDSVRNNGGDAPQTIQATRGSPDVQEIIATATSGGTVQTVVASADTNVVHASPDVNTVVAKPSGDDDGDDGEAAKKNEPITTEPVGLAEEELSKLADSSEKLGYQAEVQQLMNIIINSIYSNVDVFLRELISNSSDALDKIRVESLSDRSALGEKEELDVRIRVDEDRKQLHIIDSGVGMTKDELIANLGTIAKSGTKEYLKKTMGAESDASALIGQFGVGFYSAFLVADRVSVISKSNHDDTQWVWQSDAAQNFVVSPDPRGNTLGRGTHIILHMKDSQLEFLKHAKLEELIQRYSEFIQFPIRLWSSEEVTEEVPLSQEELDEAAAAKAKAQEDSDDGDDDDSVDIKEEEEADETDKEDEVPQPTTKTVTKTVWDWKHVNNKPPIWTRATDDVTDEEYNDFYKHISKDWQDPVAHNHFKAEGSVNFKAIVYIPKKPPMGFWDGNNSASTGVKLYVKRVFITDDWNGLLPKYISFINGVVDAEDVDLNVSREVLQQSKTLITIKKKIVRKTIGMIQKMADDEEQYREFYDDFSKALKYGILEDSTNKNRLSKLLRYHSSFAVSNTTSLEDYVSRAKENQTDIYYLAGQNQAQLEASPLVEKVLKRGFEVLYLTDPLDEYVFQGLTKFDGIHSLTNLAREGLKLPGEEEEDEEAQKKLEDDFSDVIDYLGEALKGKVRKVVISDRLTDSPAALLAGSFGVTANMERILRAQALGNESAQLKHQPKPVLEINVEHPVIAKLAKLIEANEEDPVAADTAQILFESSAVASGYSISDPQSFAKRMQKMLKRSLGVSEPAQATSEEEQQQEPVAEDDAKPAAADEEVIEEPEDVVVEERDEL